MPAKGGFQLTLHFKLLIATVYGFWPGPDPVSYQQMWVLYILMCFELVGFLESLEIHTQSLLLTVSLGTSSTGTLLY